MSIFSLTPDFNKKLNLYNQYTYANERQFGKTQKQNTDSKIVDNKN